MNILAPSILSADFCELGKQIEEIEKAGTIHIFRNAYSQQCKTQDKDVYGCAYDGDKTGTLCGRIYTVWC